MTTVRTTTLRAPTGRCGCGLRASTMSRSIAGRASISASLVIESAILGRGVALAKSTLAAADIEAGRLVRRSRLSAPWISPYYFVAPRAKLNLPK